MGIVHGGCPSPIKKERGSVFREGGWLVAPCVKAAAGRGRRLPSGDTRPSLILGPPRCPPPTDPRTHRPPCAEGRLVRHAECGSS